MESIYFLIHHKYPMACYTYIMHIYYYCVNLPVFGIFFYQIQPAYQSIKIEGALLLKKTAIKGIYTTWHKSKRNDIVKLLSNFFFYKELLSSFNCSLNIAFLIKLHLALLVGVDSVHIFSRIFSLEYDTNSSFKRGPLALVVPYVSKVLDVPFKNSHVYVLSFSV